MDKNTSTPPDDRDQELKAILDLALASDTLHRGTKKQVTEQLSKLSEAAARFYLANPTEYAADALVIAMLCEDRTERAWGTLPETTKEHVANLAHIGHAPVSALATKDEREEAKHG